MFILVLLRVTVNKDLCFSFLSFACLPSLSLGPLWLGLNNILFRIS